MFLKGKLKIANVRMRAGTLEEECVISLRSHLTNSVKAFHQPDWNNLSYRPGTTWQYQAARWTTDFNTPLVEYAVESDEIEFYLGGKLLNIGINSEWGPNVLNELVSTINREIGWRAWIDTKPGPMAEEPTLVVAATAGQTSTGFEIAYGGGPRHPAVEILFNGAWRNGAPVDGECTPLQAADYAVMSKTFAATTFDETGGRGSFGDVDAEAYLTTFSLPETSPLTPAAVGAVALTGDTRLSTLGFDGNENDEITIVGNGFELSYTLQTGNETVDNMLAELAFYMRYYKVKIFVDGGKLVVVNLNPGTTPENVLTTDPVTAPGSAALFGAFTTTEYRYWQTTASTNRFASLDTPLAQFAPKGVMEFAVQENYEQPVQRVGTVSGTGAPLSQDQNPLTTLGDLIAAINTVEYERSDGSKVLPGTLFYAYLDDGRIVVANMNGVSDPDTVLLARYLDAELLDGQPRGYREPAELFFGACDHRGNGSYRYDDTSVGGSIQPRVFETTPPATELPIFLGETARLGTRTLTSATLLSSLYPVGTFLLAYLDSFQSRLQGTEVYVSPVTTVGDLLKYLYVPGQFTARFVDADGTHEATSGFLRFTADQARVVWHDPVSKTFGDADRLFVNGGDDGTPPTNPSGAMG